MDCSATRIPPQALQIATHNKQLASWREGVFPLFRGTVSVLQPQPTGWPNIRILDLLKQCTTNKQVSEVKLSSNSVFNFCRAKI